MTNLKMNLSSRTMRRQAFEPEYKTTKQERLSLLNTAQLARITGTSKSTWEKMRVERRGPRFIKARNLVWYRWADIEIWMAAHEITTGELV